MIRNIDKLRSQGTMVMGKWLNKDVLMIEETINSAANSKLASPKSQKSIEMRPGKSQQEAMDSIFNIELSNITKAKDLMSSSYMVSQESRMKSNITSTNELGKNRAKPPSTP